DYSLRNLRYEKNLLILFEQRGQAHVKTTGTEVIERKVSSQLSRASGYIQCHCRYRAGDSRAHAAFNYIQIRLFKGHWTCVFCSRESLAGGALPLDRASQNTIGIR